MLLNELKNDQVLDYFMSLAQQCTQQKPLNRSINNINFIDLDALQQALFKNQISSDEELESIIYGTQSQPFYSGFTTRSINSLTQRFGFSTKLVNNNISTVGSKTLSLQINQNQLAHHSLTSENIEKWKYKVWSFRKKIRLKTKALATRVKKSTFPPNLGVLSKNNQLFLNLGAGEENYDGWIKVDWSGCQDVYNDITELSSVMDNSVDKIYSNHVLEHLPPLLIEKTLNCWFKKLKPNAIVMIRVPNAKACIEKLGQPWTECKPNELKQLGFPPILDKEQVLESKCLSDEIAIQCIYGWSLTSPYDWNSSNQHKSLWTPELTKKRFEKAGFKNIFCKSLGDLQTVAVLQK